MLLLILLVVAVVVVVVRHGRRVLVCVGVGLGWEEEGLSATGLATYRLLSLIVSKPTVYCNTATPPAALFSS
jgi:hypothetical protein